MGESNTGLTYKDAGVDIEAADRLVERIKDVARSTQGPAVIGGVGGFASLFSLKDLIQAGAGMDDPVLVSGTDGVGTKLKLAFQTGQHNTIGIDLVAMCVNDILTTGARPLFFLDYFGTGRLQPEVAAEVISGIAEGCRQAKCALVGGETAELPGLYDPGEYDLAGFAVGLIDRSKLVDGRDVGPGDAILGISSHGIHSNGLSLAQRVFFEHAGLSLDAPLEGCEYDVAHELLRPTAIYTSAVEALLAIGAPKAMAHITGGGLTGNLPRVLPKGVCARVDKRQWTPPAVFGHIQRLGQVEDQEMDRTFNMGIGLAVVVASKHLHMAEDAIKNAGFTVQSIGTIEPADDENSAPRVVWA